MGSGKSTIGHRLAQSLDWAFLDTDQWIEQTTGADIPWIFEKEGEAGFRKREVTALAQALEKPRQVIATRGGIVESEENRQALASPNVFCVFLSAPTDVLLTRIGTDPNRPLLQTADPSATLQSIIDRRQAWYSAAADWVVETPGKTTQALANEIKQKVQSQ